MILLASPVRSRPGAPLLASCCRATECPSTRPSSPRRPTQRSSRPRSTAVRRRRPLRPTRWHCRAPPVPPPDTHGRSVPPRGAAISASNTDSCTPKCYAHMDPWSCQPQADHKSIWFLGERTEIGTARSPHQVKMRFTVASPTGCGASEYVDIGDDDSDFAELSSRTMVGRMHENLDELPGRR